VVNIFISCESETMTLEEVIQCILNNERTILFAENKNFGCVGAIGIGNVLQHNVTLRELHLRFNNIEDEGATALANALQHNSTLRKLFLGGNTIGNKGAKALADELRYNTTLTVLCLTNNNIGDEGATALGVALQHNTTLTNLQLIDNNIGVDGAMALNLAMNTNTVLRFLDTDVDNDPVGVDIQNKIERNILLYENQYWRPELHTDFPEGFHSLVATTLLCNTNMNGAKLPDHIWFQIFGFWQRNSITED